MRLRLLCLALVGLACATDPVAPVPSPGARTPLPPAFAGVLAVVDVTVVPMTGPDLLRSRTVVVRDGVIAAIGPADEVQPPEGAEVIDGTGRFLAPGLMDMHVHLRAHEIDAYLRAGITTVRNMWGTRAALDARAAAAGGEPVPAVFSAGPGMDGDPPVWGGSEVVTEPDEAAAAVRRQAADGWDFIKVYNRLRLPVYDAILAEAARAGITVIGHVPLAADIERAMRLGQASIEHLTGIGEAVAGGRGPSAWVTMDSAAMESLAPRLAERGTWVSPTLVVLAHLANLNLSAQESALARANQRKAVRVLHDAGVPLLAGTDAGIDATAAGTSLADELQLYVQAGLTPYQALRAATVDAARFLGIDQEVGTVQVGMRADLVLLRANPLATIGAVRAPLEVILRGRRLALPSTEPPTPPPGGGPEPVP